MATLTISYDGRNKAARSIVEILRTLDFFSITEAPAKPKHKNGIEQAYKDVVAGRVFHAKDGANLIRQCLAD